MASRKEIYTTHKSARLKWYSTAEVAKIVDKSESTLKGWRRQNKGPNWYNVEGSIQYRSDDVQKYLDKRRHGSAD
jgi:hypothetical protein